ncbi:ABC transporter ATP-binding protein [Rhizosaccharibacter radicis]|uniref:ABC transporter ATP-binding protein n=1 Tax=Rhizosaccharibacter radicis TaxID=2782605 RepID=A0ABT1VSM8_9PROT|nr:ABC transporter ATP-binding protein [Acetobacteraceae bacterium KSS12]
MSFLSIDRLSKSYRKNEVIRDLSFAVDRGEFLVVFGPSGAGKTVLLRLIAGMVRPDRGRVLLGGSDITDDNPEQRDIAMAFQNFALYPHMSAFDNIGSPLRAAKVGEAERRRRVEEAAKLLRIDHVLGHLPRALSNGQKQRTALARSLVSEPSLLLLDDPLRNVDAKVRYEMRLELPRLLRARDTTVVYVTQDYKEAMALGDRIAVLADGGFQQIDTPERVYNAPASARIARLFGDPPINLLPAVRSGAGLRVASSEIALDGAAPDRAECTMGVRPEDVIVSLEQASGAIPVEIDAVTPLNDRQVMLLRADDGTEIFASQPQGTHVVPGGLPSGRERPRAWARLDVSRSHFFETASGARV